MVLIIAGPVCSAWTGALMTKLWRTLNRGTNTTRATGTAAQWVVEKL